MNSYNNFSGFNQNIPQEMMQNMMGFQQNTRNVFKPKSKMESNFDKIFAPPEVKKIQKKKKIFLTKTLE